MGIQHQGILEGISRKLPISIEPRVSSFQNYGKRSAKLGYFSAKKKSGNPCQLKPEDVETIYLLKKEKPSKRYRSMKEDRDTYCILDGGTIVAAMRNVVREKRFPLLKIPRFKL